MFIIHYFGLDLSDMDPQLFCRFRGWIWNVGRDVHYLTKIRNFGKSPYLRKSFNVCIILHPYEVYKVRIQKEEYFSIPEAP
ncbi:hypothetical protein BpJC4_30710 [Weizmannia acidilactici]|nr:hypothetical protein BpJC4_30710 [Weizmannia acidilactici]GER75011.1 hypothetical protein BpPP18_30780 [Weizmannia acidilactici]